MPIRRRQKKPNVEPQQKPKHSHAVVDPMVNPGSPAHRRQARSKADPARPHHRMVTLAQSSPSDRSARAFQSKKPTVMLGYPIFDDMNGILLEGAGGGAITNVRIRDGRRLNVPASYLYPIMDQDNLTVLTGAHVT